MKLHYRVLLAQLPALLVVVALLMLGGTTVRRLGESGHAVLRDNYRSVLAAQRMKESIERLDSAALFTLAGSPERAGPLVAEHREKFEAELRVEEGNITEAGERDVASSLRTDWDAYAATYERFLAADPEAARAIYFDTLLPEFQAVKADADRVLDLNQDAMVRKGDEAAEGAREARRSWFLWSAAGFGTAVALGVFVARRLAEPLHEMAETAGRVGEGQLDVRLPRTRVTELDALAEAFNTMAERLRLYRRASDSELARAREAAQAAIESLADPVLVLTLRGAVRATNGAARRLLGLDARSRRLEDPALFDAVEEVREVVARDGRAALPTDFSRVVVTPTPEGERAFLPHGTPINDAVTGELVGVTVLLQDVTRLRRLDELKGDLVNTVAHELRTPLTSLGMALHLALDERVSGALPSRVLELLETARDDVTRLRSLVEDLLDLSRIQEGRLVLRPTAVSAVHLLEEAREAVRVEAEGRGVGVEVEGAGTVTLDRARMQVALVNLAVNAVRHAPKGSKVVLRAKEGDGRVRFEVEDAGPGVPEADRERIFEPFVRGGEGTGAGLGLHIAREVVRAHKGRIGVEEGATGGARFWVEVGAAPGDRIR